VLTPGDERYCMGQNLSDILKKIKQTYLNSVRPQSAELREINNRLHDVVDVDFVLLNFHFSVGW
jgi:hypothetical protein